MHGRLKVKSSAQIEAENLAKREKKLKYFQHLVKQIFEFRVKQKASLYHEETTENIDQTDSDNQFENRLNQILLPILKLTAEILVNSPDIFTFWNIRREVLLELKQEFK